MILFWLLFILIVGGIVSGILARLHSSVSRWIPLAAVSLDLALAITVATREFALRSASANHWAEELNWKWIPQFGIRFHLALDGLSLPLILLTLVLGIVALLVSSSEVTQAVGFYYFNLMLVLAGIVGVLLAVDLFLFYFCWELMLVPMYFLISVWGHERRRHAAVKFFLFTQLSGLLMLTAIVALYFAHQHTGGAYSFEYLDLLGTALSPRAAMWIMLGFFAAFAVKLPMFPFHTWLPDACSEAPASVNLVLASLLASTAAYALIRFLLPLFPDSIHSLEPFAIVLAVIGILYGAILALSQTDLMRLITYASISHLGFILLGIFAGSQLALRGAEIAIVAHGVSIGALFLIAGALEHRIGTRELGGMGGLWDTVPRLSGVGLFFALASLGLPGLGDFIGEFLILTGTYQLHLAAAAVAACGVLLTTFFALRFVQRLFHGPNVQGWHLHDLNLREGIVLGTLMVLLLWLGLYPQPVFESFRQTAGPTAGLRR